MIKRKSESILGFSITTLNINQCIDDLSAWLNSKDEPKYLVCANPHSLTIALTDPMFQQAILGADLVTPDGFGIVLASKLSGGFIKKRVTGTDIFTGLSKRLNKSDKGSYRYFFLGSTLDNLSKIREKLRIDYPNIIFAGSFSPPFRSEFTLHENEQMVNAINQANPDALWVGMTAPKQEKWIYQNRNKLNVKFIGAIGAVFDFYAGTVKRSSPIFQKLGLEWLPRLMKEPGRLWKRNLVSTPRFIYQVLKHRIHG